MDKYQRASRSICLGALETCCAPCQPQEDDHAQWGARLSTPVSTMYSQDIRANQATSQRFGCIMAETRD